MAIGRSTMAALLLLALVASASALIEAPENTTYGPSVPVTLVSENTTNISYVIDSVTNGSCEDCTSYEETLELPDGTYTLEATNGTITENVTFTVQALDAYALYENETLFASSNKKANLSYAVDAGNESSLCTDCSESNTSLPLEVGMHTIVVFARTADETANETFEVEVIAIEPDFALIVDAPDNTTYLRSVPIDVSTTLEANVTYRIDGNETLLCEDCTNATETVELDAGSYEMTITATHGNETVNETVSFTISDFAIEIESPEAKTYEGDVPRNVTFTVTASEALDSINVTLDGENYSCEECEELSETVELDEGTYTLRAVGYLDGEESRRTVVFTISEMDDTDENETDDSDEPRFTVGLNKLPQAVENGEYTDEELADIIRDNELNPGVLNRLIKTGMLGEQSIDAILETQWAPPGILHRLFGWLGLGRPSVPEMVAERYNVSEEQAQRIAVRPDTPPGLAKKVVERTRERNENRNMPPGSERDGDDDRDRSMREGRPIGSQNLPPGLAKRYGDDEFEFEENVESVDVSAGTFTLRSGTIIYTDENTEFDDDINSLEALEQALENGHDIEAEIEYVIEAEKRTATEVEFDIEDDDSDRSDDDRDDDSDDRDDEREFEGYVASADADEGTFTMRGGTVIHTDENTEFDDDINSLEALEQALENGHDIEAEGEYVFHDDDRVATEVEFDIEDDDRDDDRDERNGSDDSRGRGPPWTR